MDVIIKGIDIVSKIAMAMGAGIAIWGGMHLFEGYSSDNPGAKSQGIKQLVAGGGIVIIGFVLIPMLKSMFTI